MALSFFPKNKLEHKQHVLQLFQLVIDFGFGVSINVSKCEFGKNQRVFLGHLISNDGTKPLPDKVEAIQKYLLPSNVIQLRHYLGMVQFNSRFISKAAQYLALLHDMLRGNAKGRKSLSWNKEVKKTFF